MVDINALKAEMARNGYNNTTLAPELGMTPRTFYSRLKKGEFYTKEIEVMIDKLHLSDPLSIFFA